MEQTYEKLATRTAVTKYNDVIERFGEKPQLAHLINTLCTFKVISNILDDSKKYFYYGKGQIEMLNDRSLDDVSDKFKARIQDPQLVDIVHGLLGIITESGEILDAVLTAINNEDEIDTVNISEELGDIFWYAALITNTLGTSFDKVQFANIRKLQKRYPQGFTEQDAINRNLSEERQNLEASFESK
jgi:NTP pyrophosphatase (non-canonical NTP hydrolase)